MRGPVHLRPLLVLALVALAGCSTPSKEATLPAPTAVPHSMDIVGLVQDEGFVPVAGAHVALRLTNRTATTDASGGFRFDGLAVSAYLVDVNATGFEDQTLTAEPRDGNQSVNFVLRKPTSLRPRTEVTHIRGFLQCASEELIITGSCDAASTSFKGPGVFNDTSTFDVGLGRRWDSIVVDVDFDSQPGIDGLRLVVRGINDGDTLGSYQQYGRFHDSTSFTARLDVNGTYPDGAASVPGNLTIVRMDVYPQGYGWHDACDPVVTHDCFLGAGAAIDVSFDLYVTVFYNQLAPDGYSLLPH